MSLTTTYVQVFRLAHGPRAQEAFNKMGGKSLIYYSTVQLHKVRHKQDI